MYVNFVHSDILYNYLKNYEIWCVSVLGVIGNMRPSVLGQTLMTK